MSASRARGTGVELVRLLQLASPALPIGAYSYSQGLEWVAARGIVRDAATAQAWIGDMMLLVLASGEGAVTWRMLCAADASDWRRLAEWDAWFLASRETSELRAETTQMGAALFKLAVDLELIELATLEALAPSIAPTLPAAFALAAKGFDVESEAALTGYLWAWLENQVIAAIKAVPLGQVAGQRMLKHLGADILRVVAVAQATSDDDVTSFAPGLALASARHETQYTRLFRS